MNGSIKWLPVGDEPRNGVPILLWVRGRAVVARWFGEWGCWIDNECPFPDSNADWFGIGANVPTHWALINSPEAQP